MKKIKVFFLFLFLIGVIFGAEISSEAEKLEKMRLKVQNDSRRENCLNYLDAFPVEFKKFRAMFNCINPKLPELCDTASEHLSILENLSKKYTLEVIKIWFSLAKDGFWDADAVTMLQFQIVEFGSLNTELFTEILKKNKHKRGIIKFLADVRDHNDYFRYKELILKLKIKKHICLYNLFIEARNERTRHWLGHDYKDNK